ncbi:MAG: FtsX-like permease family protein [Gemmatimonadales bacterium]|jgi:putative ABC transport system permease protein
MRALVCAVLLAVLTASAGQAQALELALERSTAVRLGLQLGDTVRLGTAPDSLLRLGVVRAIYQARPDPAEIARRALQARFHLPDLAELLGAPDRVDRFGLALAPGVSPDSAAAEVNRSAFGFRAYPSAEIASESSRTFKVVSRFHRAIAVITIVASAVFLLCIMLLKVEERRLDAAVMRFVGVRRRTIFYALLLEAAALAVAGSVLGIAIALAAGAATNAYYQRFFDTQLVFSVITPRIVALGVGLSLVLGLAAGAIAAARLVRTRPMVLWGRA